MKFKKQYVVVEAAVPVPVDPDAHPEFPIYIPIVPPPDSGLHPELPIYFPVGIWGGGNEPLPTPPIFIPVPRPPEGGGGGGDHVELPIYYPITIWPRPGHPEHPIELPPDLPPEVDKEKLKAFLLGNLPPFDPPDYVAPMGEK